MKILRRAAVLAALLGAIAGGAQASTVAWEAVRMDGGTYTTFIFYGTKTTVLAGGVIGHISGWGSLDGDYLSFCTDPSTLYSPNYIGTPVLMGSDVTQYLSFIAYGIRDVNDYASAQMAVWEVVVDVARGSTFDFSDGSFISGDGLVLGAEEIIERGRILAASSPRLQFWDIVPNSPGVQSFGISTTIQAVPEPATATIVSLGLFGLLLGRRRKV